MRLHVINTSMVMGDGEVGKEKEKEKAWRAFYPCPRLRAPRRRQSANCRHGTGVVAVAHTYHIGTPLFSSLVFASFLFWSRRRAGETHDTRASRLRMRFLYVLCRNTCGCACSY